MAKYVYVVERKSFYDDNGVSTPMATGCDYTHCFSSFQKAEKYILDEIEALIGRDEATPANFETYPMEHLNPDIIGPIQAYAMTTYNHLGVRYAFALAKFKIN